MQVTFWTEDKFYFSLQEFIQRKTQKNYKQAKNSL